MKRQNDLEDLVPRDVALFMMPKADSEAEVDFLGWQTEISVAGGETSDILYAKDDVAEIGMQVAPEGTAYIEYTLSPMSEAASGSADWVKWDPGDVTENTAGFTSKSITALRLVSVSGAADADIRTEV